MAGSVALATQEYAARFFSQGARPDYILQGANDPTDEQLTRLRDEIDAHHRGVSNSRRPMILTGGLEFQSISLPLEDVQLLALRQFQVEEIARAYLVPPFMIGHNEKTTSWGSGVEAMGVGFVRYTLRNYLNTIETEFNRKLYRGGNKFLAFDTTELERADTKSLFESFRIALGRAGEKPFMTSDEVRQRLNLKRTPGGASMEMAGTQPKDAADAQAV
jgi:HK97 family phage portal protein